MSSRPNGPAVVYEYITNTKEKRPTFLRARVVLWLDLPTGLPAFVEFKPSPQSARRLHERAISGQVSHSFEYHRDSLPHTYAHGAKSIPPTGPLQLVNRSHNQ